MYIKPLPLQNMDQFYSIFINILNSEFPEYTPKQIDYFINILYPVHNVKRMILGNLRKIFVAEKNNEIVGFLMADQTYGGVGFISWFGILSEFRKQGIGAKMVEEYEKFCRTKNAHLIEVYTFPRIVPFYEKIGFHKVGVRPKGYFGVPNVIMDREIIKKTETSLT